MGEDNQNINDKERFRCKVCATEYKKKEEAELCAMSGCNGESAKVSEWQLIGEPYLRLHPTQDIFRDELWYGFFSRIKNNPYGRDWSDKSVSEIETLTHCNSSGDMFPAFEDHLRMRKITLLSSNTTIQNHWSIESINRWKNGWKPEPREVFEAVRESFDWYMDYSDFRVSAFLASWVIGSYFYRAFNFYPYIAFHGIKGTAKSKSLRLLSYLAFNSELELSPTEAGIYRGVEETRGTLCFDEYDGIDERTRGAIHAILRSGFQKGGVVKRNKKMKINGCEGFGLERLETYSPKAFAGVWELQEFSERCVRVLHKKTTDMEKASRYPNADDLMFQEARDLIYPFALTYWKDIVEIYNSIENKFEDGNGGMFNFEPRPWDIWRPVLSTAKFIGEDVFQEVLEYAKQIEEDRKSEESNKEEFILLESLQSVVSKMPRADGKYAIKDIWDILKESCPELYDWDEPKQRRSIEKRVGFAFRRLGIEKRRRGTGNVYTITPEVVQDLVDRCGIKKAE
jgi:hypothetical protein